MLVATVVLGGVSSPEMGAKMNKIIMERQCTKKSSIAKRYYTCK